MRVFSSIFFKFLQLNKTTLSSDIFYSQRYIKCTIDDDDDETKTICFSTSI